MVKLREEKESMAKVLVSTQSYVKLEKSGSESRKEPREIINRKH